MVYGFCGKESKNSYADEAKVINGREQSPLDYHFSNSNYWNRKSMFNLEALFLDLLIKKCTLFFFCIVFENNKKSIIWVWVFLYVLRLLRKGMTSLQTLHVPDVVKPYTTIKQNWIHVSDQTETATYWVPTGISVTVVCAKRCYRGPCQDHTHTQTHTHIFFFKKPFYWGLIDLQKWLRFKVYNLMLQHICTPMKPSPQSDNEHAHCPPPQSFLMPFCKHSLPPLFSLSHLQVTLTCFFCCC